MLEVERAGLVAQRREQDCRILKEYGECGVTFTAGHPSFVYESSSVFTGVGSH